jgi:hypothetical protein
MMNIKAVMLRTQLSDQMKKKPPRLRRVGLCVCGHGLGLAEHKVSGDLVGASLGVKGTNRERLALEGNDQRHRGGCVGGERDLGDTKREVLGDLGLHVLAGGNLECVESLHDGER